MAPVKCARPPRLKAEPMAGRLRCPHREFHGARHPVVRYDTSHGYAHRDLMHADGSKEKTELSLGNLNICLTYAENDLRANWRLYRERFLREVG